MKKLRLNVEELRVESFASTDLASGERGTVHGQAKATYACTAGWDTCDTQADSCHATCVALTGCGQASQCVGWCMSQHDSCSCIDCSHGCSFN